MLTAVRRNHDIICVYSINGTIVQNGNVLVCDPDGSNIVQFTNDATADKKVMYQQVRPYSISIVLGRPNIFAADLVSLEQYNRRVKGQKKHDGIFCRLVQFARRGNFRD